jgi:hypothetical protein
MAHDYDPLANDSVKRADETLLRALSLVLSSNSEYAKSLSAVLNADLEREHVIEQIDFKVRELLENTNRLIESQDELSDLLKTFNEDNKILLETMLVSFIKKQADYMDTKFAYLFIASGLKCDGSEYPPMDKLVIKIKEALSHQIWYLLSGALIYHFILALIKTWGH